MVARESRFGRRGIDDDFKIKLSDECMNSDLQSHPWRMTLEELYRTYRRIREQQQGAGSKKSDALALAGSSSPNIIDTSKKTQLKIAVTDSERRILNDILNRPQRQHAPAPIKRNTLQPIAEERTSELDLENGPIGMPREQVHLGKVNFSDKKEPAMNEKISAEKEIFEIEDGDEKGFGALLWTKSYKEPLLQQTPEGDDEEFWERALTTQRASR